MSSSLPYTLLLCPRTASIAICLLQPLFLSRLSIECSRYFLWCFISSCSPLITTYPPLIPWYSPLISSYSPLIPSYPPLIPSCSPLIPSYSLTSASPHEGRSQGRRDDRGGHDDISLASQDGERCVRLSVYVSVTVCVHVYVCMHVQLSLHVCVCVCVVCQ